MRKILALASLSALPLSANAAPAWDWQWLNPRPTGNNLIEAAFQDARRGTLIADNGETAETRDGGESWTVRPGRIASNTLVAATTRDGVLILGGSIDGEIWKSSDGGGTWKSLFKASGSLYDIGLCGPQGVVAVGADGLIVRSEDQGDTWALIRSEESGPDLLGLHCGDAGLTMAAGESGKILRSRDHGKTWQALPEPSPVVDLTSIAFADTSRGFATTAWGRVLDTQDGGRTWRTTTLDTLSFFRGIRVDGLDITVTGSNGGIWKSTDGGRKWFRSPAETPYFLAASVLAGAGTEILVGNVGTILKSTDGGATWRPRQVGTTQEILGLARLSPSTWVAFGGQGLVMKTDDHGRTWKESSLGDNMRIQAGSFLGRRGLLSTHHGAIFLSGDSGATWSAASVPSKGRILFGLAWCNPGAALAVGDSGTLLRSTDGGQSWNLLQAIPGLTDQALSAVVCMESGAAHIVGYRGLILKSSDLGATWKAIPTPVDENLFGLSFLDGSTGMAVGAHGTVQLTRDGGATWSPLNTGFEDDHSYGVAWVGKDTAVLVADWLHYSRIRITTDGGRTWEELPNLSRKIYWALAGLDSGRVAVMGQEGALLLGRLSTAPSGIGIIGTSARDRSGMRVSRMEMLPWVRITLPPQVPKRIRIAAYTLEGRWLQQVYSGEPPAGRQPLQLRFPNRRAPVIFRLQGAGEGKSADWVSILVD